MMKNVSRVLWLISGALLIVVGIVAVCNPASTVASLAVFLGLAMLLSGISSIVGYGMATKYFVGGGWMLADGILTCVLALFVLFNSSVTASAIPFIFGLWVVFSSVERMACAFDLKRDGVSGWGWILALALLGIVMGVVALLDPIVAAVALSVIVGVLLISTGVMNLCMWGFLHKWDRF